MDEILVTVNIMKTRLRMAILLSLSLSCSALAEIYVITNKDGTKTFTDTPPANSADGSTVQPNTTNVWEKGENQQQLNEEYQAETAREQAQQAEVSSAKNNELEEAAERLQRAKDAYEQAQEVQEDDYFRNKKGGIRYKPEYQQRIDAAKQELEDAQNEYDNLQ